MCVVAAYIRRTMMREQNQCFPQPPLFCNFQLALAWKQAFEHSIQNQKQQEEIESHSTIMKGTLFSFFFLKPLLYPHAKTGFDKYRINLVLCIFKSTPLLDVLNGIIMWLKWKKNSGILIHHWCSMVSDDARSSTHLAGMHWCSVEWRGSPNHSAPIFSSQ